MRRRLRAALTRRNGAWPDSLTVPLWHGWMERRALVHWMDEISAKTGKRIRVEFKPVSSDTETTVAFTASRRIADLRRDLLE